MTAAEWMHISRSQSRAWPYAWQCTFPVTTGLVTEDCGTFSVAVSRDLAEQAHRAHFDREHTEASR